MPPACWSRPDLKVRARAQMWMDWQLSVMGPAITPVFWQLIRTPADKRDPKLIAAGKEKTIAAAKIMDEQLGRTAYLAGDAFSYGDIPVGIMIYRYVQLIPERPSTPNLDRWYAAISRASRVQGTGSVCTADLRLHRLAARSQPRGCQDRSIDQT